MAALVFGVGEEERPGGGSAERQDGRFVLHEGRVPDGDIPGAGSPRQATEDRIESIRRKLLDARGERPRPFEDTKVLADWNGLMIAALAGASG